MSFCYYEVENKITRQELLLYSNAPLFQCLVTNAPAVSPAGHEHAAGGEGGHHRDFTVGLDKSGMWTLSFRVKITLPHICVLKVFILQRYSELLTPAGRMLPHRMLA